MKIAASKEPNNLNPSSIRSMNLRNLPSLCENLTDMMMSQMTFEMDTARIGLRSVAAFFFARRTHRNSSTSAMMRFSIWFLRDPI